MKEINVEEAGSWSEDEAAYNVAYLRARNRNAEADAIVEALGGEPEAATESDDLMDYKKDELLAMAEERGVEVSESMTKAEIVEAMQAG